MTLRAGNLGRVSKDKSGEARSVEEQHAENKAVAVANGWAIVADYEDVMSASRFAAKAREDWPRLVADVDAGKLDVVILWEPSRGTRKLGEWISFLDLCRERGVLIHVTSHQRTYDLTSRRDRKALIEDGTDAEDESERTSERVKRALAANRDAGMPHSPPPYGLRAVYDERGRLNRDQPRRIAEDEAAVVRDVIGRVAAGVPLSVIERESGVRRSTVRKWCHCAAYAGKVRTPAGLVEAKWPAITDEGTWRAAQAALAGKPRAGVNSRPGGARYLLSGIMACSACLAPVEADPARPGRRAAYACRAGHVTIAQAGADDVIREIVIRRCAKDDLYTLLTAASGGEAEAARAEAVTLQAELDEWLEAGISARAYRIKEDWYLPRIIAAKDRAEALTVPTPVRDLATARDDAAEVWDHRFTVPQRRAAVRFLFEWIKLGKSPRPGPGIPAHERITVKLKAFEASA